MAEEKIVSEKKEGAPAVAEKAAERVAEKPVAKALASGRVIQHPLATEKAVSGIETRNEITLVVSIGATKRQVREEAEKTFGAKVLKVRTGVYGGRKKAVVKFAKAGAASDVAAKLKIV